MFLELSAGLVLDGARVGAGMRVRVPADVGGWVLAQGWASKAPGPHRIPGGRSLLAARSRDLPGVDESPGDWPIWMRPAWVRPDGRAVPSGDDRRWLPVACPSCLVFGYVRRTDRVAGVALAPGSDARLVRCRGCKAGS